MKRFALFLAGIAAGVAHAQDLTFALYTKKQGGGTSVGSLATFDDGKYLETGCIRGGPNDRIWSFGTTILSPSSVKARGERYCVFTFGDNDCECVGGMYPVDGVDTLDFGAQIGNFNASAPSGYVSKAACPEKPPCPFDHSSYKGASFDMAIPMTEDPDE